MPNQMREEWVFVPLNQPLLISLRGIFFGEVIRFRGYDMSNSAPGIVYIAGIPGDHMKMEMEDCLSSRRSEIEANVEAVRRMARSNDCDRLVNCRPSP